MALTSEQINSMTLAELDARERVLVDELGPDINTLSPAGLDLREEQVSSELNSLGVSIPKEPEVLSPEDSFQRDKDIMRFAVEFPSTDPTDIDENIEALKVNAPVVNKIGFKEVFAEKDYFEALPFVGTLYKTQKIGKVIQAVGRLSNVKDSPTRLYWEDDSQFIDRVIQFKKDEILVEKWVEQLDEAQTRGYSIGGRIAQGVIELPAFMVEFLLTGPIFKTGSAGAKSAATRILGRFADKGVGKLAVKVAGAGFGTFARTAVNVPRVLAGAAERMTEGLQITDDGTVVFADAELNPFGALARSFTDLYIENLSEITGPSLKKGVVAIGTGIGKKFPVLGKFTQALSDKWIANKAGRTINSFLKASATKVGYDGILEEMGEERVGAILRAVTGLGTFGEIIPTWEDLLVEAGIFSVPGGVSLATSKAFRADQAVAMIERDLGKVTETERLLRPEQDEPLTPEFMQAHGGQAVERILLFESEKNTKLSEEQNAAAMEFLESRINEKKLSEKDRLRINANLPEDFEKFVEDIEITTKPVVVTEKLVGEPQAPTVEQKVVETTVKTKTDGIKANQQEASVEPTGTIDAIRRSVLRTEDALGFWGTAGKKIQRDLREISHRTAVNVGNTSQNIRAIFKGLNAKEKVVVAQLTDGAISSEGQPNRLTERAHLLKQQLDIMQNEAIAVGLRKQGLTGKAFPQVPNKEGKAFLEEAEVKGAQSRRVFAWAQGKVNDGKFETVDSAIAALQNYRRTRLRGTEGYFEGTRTIELDLDMREWNPNQILPGVVEGGWESIEGTRQWGVTKDGNFKDIRTSIERIRTEVGVDQANAIEDYIKAQYGQSRASATAKKWSKRARAVQFVGKLAISPLTITRNMMDRYAKGLTHGTIGTNIRATVKFPPFLNKFLKTSQKIQDEMIRQGAVLGHGHLSEGFASGGAISRFVGQPFALSERGNQTYIAIVKQLQLEADVKRLNEMGGEQGTIGKMYNRALSIIGQSQQQTRNRTLTDLTNEQLADALDKGEVSDEVMSEVLHRTVTDSAFPLTLASKRMWWGNRPWVQTMTQFKIWSADQMRFISKDVLKYTVATGDPSRMFRFILGTWIAGELYNIARDFLTDRDESLLSTLKDEDGRNFKEISKSMANALVDGGIVGMLADLTYGITDWVFGPTVGSLESATRAAIAVKNDPATTVDGLKWFLLEDVPAARQAQGVLDRLDRTFFDENNLTENYSKWRGRAFEFQREKGELSVLERAAGRIVLGRPTRTPGPRTLSLEMLSRQVLVGDFDDAADYIKGIFRDTPVEKIGDVSQAIDTSARNRSPFGNISQENLPLFLSKFSVEGQAEGIKLQLKWLKGYEKAKTIAVKELVVEGFEKELEIKAEDFKDKVTPQIEKFKATRKELEALLEDVK